MHNFILLKPDNSQIDYYIYFNAFVYIADVNSHAWLKNVF